MSSPPLGTTTTDRTYLKVLISRFQQAIAMSSKTGIEALSLELIDRYKRSFRQAAEPVQMAVRGSDNARPPLAEAFMLGQLGFAQLLATSIAESRAPDDFSSKLRETSFIEYVKHLHDSDLSGVELASRTMEREETVSRKLRVLRELGAVEFRKDGVKVVNFLTPSGRACAKEIIEEMQNQKPAESTDKTAQIKQKHIEKLPQYMRRSPTFSSFVTQQQP